MLKPPGAEATVRDVRKEDEFEGVEAWIDMLKSPGAGATALDVRREDEFESLAA